jgi:NAD(P)H dehydrogenase (quinone)
VLRPTRFMNYTPFAWNSVLEHGLLLESSGEGAMTVIAPADIAAVALVALTTDGHEGQTYDLTSEDLFTPRELGDLLSRARGRELTLLDGNSDALRAALVRAGAPEAYAPLMARYFALVAAGFWHATDTVGRLLGRKPQSYAQWLAGNLPQAH